MMIIAYITYNSICWVLEGRLKSRCPEPHPRYSLRVITYDQLISTVRRGRRPTRLYTLSIVKCSIRICPNQVGTLRIRFEPMMKVRITLFFVDLSTLRLTLFSNIVIELEQTEELRGGRGKLIVM